MPSVGRLVAQTGGDLHWNYTFDRDFDPEKVYYKLFRILTRPCGYECALICRVSTGYSVTSYVGGWGKQDSIDM